VFNPKEKERLMEKISSHIIGDSFVGHHQLSRKGLITIWLARRPVIKFVMASSMERYDERMQTNMTSSGEFR